jgi:hypothetical protein
MILTLGAVGTWYYYFDLSATVWTVPGGVVALDNWQVLRGLARDPNSSGQVIQS